MTHGTVAMITVLIICKNIVMMDTHMNKVRSQLFCETPNIRTRTHIIYMNKQNSMRTHAVQIPKHSSFITWVLDKVQLT